MKYVYEIQTINFKNAIFFTLYFNFRKFCFQTIFLPTTFHFLSIFNKRKIGLRGDDINWYYLFSSVFI